MIFVTVGTHEQPFNRLVEYMDQWAETHDEEVIIQTGFSTYEPKHCKWQKLFTYQEMVGMVDKARIVITHGGPSSFIMPLQVGKIPIVVPRRKKFDEHVNDHQAFFCKAVAQRLKNIIVVNDIVRMEYVLDRYNSIIKKRQGGLVSNNMKFCQQFEEEINDLFHK